MFFKSTYTSLEMNYMFYRKSYMFDIYSGPMSIFILLCYICFCFCAASINNYEKAKEIINNDTEIINAKKTFRSELDNIIGPNMVRMKIISTIIDKKVEMVIEPYIQKVENILDIKKMENSNEIIKKMKEKKIMSYQYEKIPKLRTEMYTNVPIGKNKIAYLAKEKYIIRKYDTMRYENDLQEIFDKDAEIYKRLVQNFKKRTNIDETYGYFRNNIGKDEMKEFFCAHGVFHDVLEARTARLL
ncbi:hypothetical protein BDAP_002716 [Binucleata daphniae]